MKTTFKQYLLESNELPKAESIKDLLDSIVDKRFTKDGGQLKVGGFTCNDYHLRSLKGCPETINGFFSCNGNELKSLEGCPKSITGSFDCSDNDLESLEGCPSTITGVFICRGNQLESLEGAPKTAGKGFYCDENHLTSLESIHMHVHEIGGIGEADFRDNPIKSHVLGLLKIKGIKRVYLDNMAVSKIINKYLLGDISRTPSLRDIVDCQEELMDNDLEDYALL